MPGLNPVRVWAVAPRPADRYDVAFLEDERERRWTIRAPRTSAAGADLENASAVVALLARRLPFSVPAPTGFVRTPEGRAVVHPFLAGRSVDLAAVPSGAGLAGDLGRVLAAIHNVDRSVYDEAGLPAYDAETHRQRRLAELDRAAATGHVPATLLRRWEQALDDVSLWRFAATPVHGSLTGDRFLATFDDEDDASTGRIKAITGWESARIADPAEDFADIVALAGTSTLDAVLTSYASHLVERVDPHLVQRAHLASEMAIVTELLAAVTAADRELIASYAATLRDREHDADHPSLRVLRSVPAPFGAADETGKDPGDAVAVGSSESASEPTQGFDTAHFAALDDDEDADERLGGAEPTEAIDLPAELARRRSSGQTQD